MKVSREQAAENRARVLDVAGRLFRENGFDGISVAEIMRGRRPDARRLYGQFGSRMSLPPKRAHR